MTKTRKQLETVLTVEQILSAKDLPTHTLYIPEWGGAVTIRGLTKEEELDAREAAKDATTGDIHSDLLEMGILIAGMVEPKFNSDQIVSLAQKAAGPVTRLIREVMSLSGMLGTSVAAAEKSFRERPEQEVPVQAGDGTGNDDAGVEPEDVGG